MNNNLEQLCLKFNLGPLEKDPEMVTGGLMHKMYHVVTSQGEYAIKVLNPDIMKRPKALQNMINSEMVSNKLKGIIPLVAAKRFDGKNILECDGSYYVIFDWLTGKSVFAPEITVQHCRHIGRILGQIHAANIQVDSIERGESSRDVYDWNGFIDKAGEKNAECHSLLKENLEDVVQWDRAVVHDLQEISQNLVISHCDLDPKNVMWKDDKPYIIDWEAAGYVNPFQELVEVLNYWIADETGAYDKSKFTAFMEAYTENVNISNVNWEAVFNCSFDSMLGWLEYNVKRALGLEGISPADLQEGLQQAKGTINELKKYDAQITQLKERIEEYGRKDSI